MNVRYFLLPIFLITVQMLHSQKKDAPKQVRVLFVFDASKSMSARFESATRMDGAKNLFYRFIDSLGKNSNMQFALRMYGHTVKYPPGDCGDSRLLVPFGANNLTLIKQKVTEARPTGITPIEHSLTEAARDFKDNKTTNIVILITDGIEECGGDPCRARQKLLEKGIVFRPFIIGIGLTPEQIKTFECVGDYYDFASAETFSAISNIIQEQRMLKTTVQVNIFDQGSRPQETNVNMTFYDEKRGAYKYNYIHTLNQQGNPDTLYVDEYPHYKVVAHTIPPTESPVQKLNTGKHNIIPIDAPQGYLRVNRQAGAYNFNEKVKFIVRKGEEMKTLNVQPLNNTEKYLIGEYDLEILTLPRIIKRKVMIRQSNTTELTIPNAGMVVVKTLEPGDGSILVDIEGQLERVCNLGTARQEVYYLQPGNYVCVWRAKALRGSIYTVERKFTVRSDGQTVLELFK